MRKILTDPIRCGWPAKAVTTLAEPRRSDETAVRLRTLTRTATDALLVYYVGHGVRTPTGELYLAVTETSWEDADLTGLPFEVIRRAVSESPAQVKFVILDCSWSGLATQALGATETVADLIDIAGAYTLTSTRGSATDNWDTPPKLRGLTPFTGELIRLIQEGVPGGPPYLTLANLYPQLQHRLRAHGLPAAGRYSTDTVGSWVFARNVHRTAFSSRPRRISLAARDALFVPSLRIRRRTILLSGLGLAAAAGVPTGIRLLRGPQSKPLAVLEDPLGSVTDITFTSDGKTLLAVNGETPTIRIWDVAKRQSRATLTDPDFDITVALAISPDGRTLATGTQSGSLHLWDLAARRVKASFPKYVTSLSFSPDGKTLAYCLGNGIIRLWDPATHHIAGTLTDPDSPADSASYSPDGKTLVTAAGTLDAMSRIRLWDMDSHEITTTLYDPHGRVYSAAFHPDGALLATCDGTIRLWDLASGKIVAEIADPTGPVFSAVFSPDGTQIATCSGNDGTDEHNASTIRLWPLPKKLHRADTK
jgi:sugar lactone lactonase YvrE